jgi:molybdopterin synthase sulfur carrier subunit
MTGGKSEIEMEGNSIAQLIENLGAAHPGLKERLYDEKGEVRRFINIYVNEEDIRFLTGKDTPLKDGDEVSIIPAIAGGA